LLFPNYLQVNMSAQTNAIFKLAYRFTLNGAPLVGYTVAITTSGTNDPVHVFSENTGTLKFANNRFVTDADGNISVYVRKGNYRLTLLSGDGTQMSVVDPVFGSMDGVRSDAVTPANVIDVPYAATILPLVSATRTIIRVGTLTGAMTVSDPGVTNNSGKELVFLFTQDATGARAVTWGSSFNKAADAAGTANQKGATLFVCDGAKWIQVGGALTYR
jgi:hypothetical protein